MPIQHELILNPITAVKFCQNATGESLILAGEGSFLKVFDAASNKLLCQCEIFNGQSIHGIALRQALEVEKALRIVIWGGPFLLALTNQDFEKLLSLDIQNFVGQATSGPDWILDVALCPEDSNSFALVTAHNTVLQARLDQKSKVLLSNPSSPSRCILYSAHLTWDNSSSLLVAAGTVFGEIILWTCGLSAQNEVLHTFTSHEGSIFGVDISVPITFHDGTVGRLLASCSDDRTIRVWRIIQDATAKDSEVDNIVLRQTGFGDNEVRDNPSDSKPLATTMGHASRIWRVKFLVEERLDSASDRVSVLSFGEDSTTQYWDLDFGDDPTRCASNEREKSSHIEARLNQRNTFNFHSGKHIWSTALYRDGIGGSRVLSGGADGKIVSYNVDYDKTYKPRSQERDQNKVANPDVKPRPESWEIEDVLKNFHAPKPDHVDVVLVPAVGPSLVSELENGQKVKKAKVKKIPKDAFNRYGFVSKDRVLVTTTFGRVFLGKIKDHVEWSEISLSGSCIEGLRSYVTICSFPELGMAFLAGSSGKIFMYQCGNLIREVGDVGSKVADLFKISSADGGFELLVTTLNGQVATLFTLDVSSPNSVSLGKGLEYQLPSKFVVTSSGRINNFLVLGSRAGSIALYHPNSFVAPKHVWIPSVSSPESITAIVAITSTSAENFTSYILATDRDGKYTIFSCTTNQNSTTLLPIHHGHPPLGPMIESAWFAPSVQNTQTTSDLILYGFKGKSFIVYNESQHQEISNVECGGAHRSYAYSPLSTTGKGGHFIYTRASKLYIHSQKTPSHSIIKKGGHGREIKACAISSDGEYIATGAEDTEIRLWSYNSPSTSPSSPTNMPNQNNLSCKAIIQRHTTGIQHLEFHSTNSTSKPRNTYLVSSGGNEELFIWALTPIPGFGTGVICQSAYPDATTEHDLRIMCFDVSSVPISPRSGEEEMERMLITMVFSDSTIKSYSYGRETGWILLATGKYTSSCLMQIRHLVLNPNEMTILTAGTDGRLVLWICLFPPPVPTSAASGIPKFQIITTTTPHQNSIKSLALTHTNHHILVATGGDDNALAITLYNTDDLEKKPRSWVLTSAHVGAVTGVVIVSHPVDGPATDVDGERFRVVSTSNDQRVKQWNIDIKFQSTSHPSSEDDENMAANVEASITPTASTHPVSLPASREDLSLSISLSIDLESDTFTAVADVGDMLILPPHTPHTTLPHITHSHNTPPHNIPANDVAAVARGTGSKIMVVGNGIEFWNVVL